MPLHFLRLIPRFARFCALALALSVPGLAAAGPEKMALVVGNAAYAHVPGLETATHDAQDVAASLRELGFEVTLLTDVGSEVFWVVLDTFAEQAKDADTVMFYYAGHAFQSGGVNHLVPVSARLETPESIGAETWKLDTIAGRLRGGSAQVLLFLDACRTSPLPDALLAAGGEGLAQFDGGAGTFVAFATRPGAVAFDRAAGGRNSPFTAALLARVATPGQSISDLMIGVRNAVDQATGGQQVPWDQSSLRAQVFLVPEVADALPQFEFAQDATVVGPLAAPDSVVRQVGGGDLLRLAAVNSETRSLAPVAQGEETLRLTPVPPVVRTAPVVGGALAVPVAGADLNRAIQIELKRIGCYNAGIDGDWGRGSQAALGRYYDARKVKEADVEGGFKPTEAAWRALLTEAEKTCAPVKVVQPVKKKPNSAGSSTNKKPAAVKKAAPAPAPAPEKKGVTCKFMVVALVCK